MKNKKIKSSYIEVVFWFLFVTAVIAAGSYFLIASLLERIVLGAF